MCACVTSSYDGSAWIWNFQRCWTLLLPPKRCRHWHSSQLECSVQIEWTLKRALLITLYVWRVQSRVVRKPDLRVTSLSKYFFCSTSYALHDLRTSASIQFQEFAKIDNHFARKMITFRKYIRTLIQFCKKRPAFGQTLTDLLLIFANVGNLLIFVRLSRNKIVSDAICSLWYRPGTPPPWSGKIIKFFLGGGIPLWPIRQKNSKIRWNPLKSIEIHWNPMKSNENESNFCFFRV